MSADPLRDVLSMLDASILPTHTCFDDALDYLAHRLKADPASEPRFTLVHGILLAPEGAKAGTPFAHAWVEEDLPGGVVVWQDGYVDLGGFEMPLAGGTLRAEHDLARVSLSTPAAEWRAKMQLQKETRYTVREAWAENRRTVTFGPWEPEYQALCGGGETFWPEGREPSPLRWADLEGVSREQAAAEFRELPRVRR